jgi:nuclear transport factor 2 (NTF2) superfamily protein
MSPDFSSRPPHPPFMLETAVQKIRIGRGGLEYARPREGGFSFRDEPLQSFTRKNCFFVYWTMTSTRRFLARPSAVLLLATGFVSP